MPTLKQIIFASVLVCALLARATAQGNTSSAAQGSLTITAAAAGERVRITAPSSIVQMHVEVYASSGEKLFDQEIRGGNVFDWHLQNGQAQRLAPGNYVCVVTAKSISGKLTQKIGTVSVEEKSASVQPAESPQLTAAQAQTIGPVEENSSWTIPGSDEPQTPTVIANDGTDGQMIRGRGVLTFRIGNFFSGNDQEQMRLTEDGRLGVGTSNPQAQLDVAGTIRAQRFLVAKPNTPGSDRKAQAPDASDSVQPLASGSGTQDRIAKWTDNAGTLGDSAIAETGGNVGIGTTMPGSKLVVSANTAALPAASGIARFADADGAQTAVFADAFSNNAIFNVRRANGTAASPSAVQADQLLGVIGASGYGGSAYMGTRARVAFWASEMWTNTANGTYLTFNTTAYGAATAGGTERMRIDSFGNVGIGTSNTINGKLVVESGSGNGVYSRTTTGGGVVGISTNGIGVYGQSNSGLGVFARSNSGNIIEGWNNGFTRAFFFANDGTLNLPANGLVAGTYQLVLSGGKVGIGTASPANNLSVVGGADFTGNVGIGTTAQTSRLHVDSGGEAIYARGISGIGIHARSEQTWAGYFEGFAFFSRGITLTELANGGSGNPLCRTAANEISNCSSSLRYKRDVRSFSGGLDIINRLRPISFTWKAGGMHDVGLAAEEVEQVEPLLTFRNNKGEIEGVKYNQLSAVFINAFKEQQSQIEKQQQQLQRQEEQARRQQAAFAMQYQELEALKKLVCRSHRSASFCR